MKELVVNLDIEFENYFDLIKFFQNNPIDKEKYYFEKHHIIPRFEGGTDNDGIVCLPFKYHVLAHYLRAKLFEGKDKFKEIGNYESAWMILVNNSLKDHIREVEKAVNNFSKEYYDIKEKHLKNCIKNLNYDSRKKVICLNDLQIIDSVTEAQEKYKQSRQYISRCCNNGGTSSKCYYRKTSYFFQWYDEHIDLNIYKKMYEDILKNPIKSKKKSWSKEDLDRVVALKTGKSWASKRSYKIKRLEDGKIFFSCTNCEKETGLQHNRWSKTGKSKIVYKGFTYEKLES
jgi:hypothetical protein